MESKISIIIPSLNMINYIKECMDSILSQTLDDLEIICVDAESTDGTLEILQEYVTKDSRIQLIKSDKKSYGYQMNLGLKAAQGEYIGIVEPDDYVLPEMFEYLYEIAYSSNVDFVKSGYTRFFEADGCRFKYNVQNTKTRFVNGIKINLDEQKLYRLADINHIWSGVYNRQFLLDHDLWFNETPGASFQDTSFSILVGLVAKNCIYTDKCYYHYRTDRPGSSVKSNFKYQCIIDEFSYIDQYLRKHGIDSEENKRLVNDAKLNAYKWNLLRLSEQGREAFRNEISEEMNCFIRDGEILSWLSENQKQEVELLIDPQAVKRLELEQKSNKQKLLEAIQEGRKGEKYIFAGAGRYLQKFLDIQRLIDCNMLEAVCDNKKELQGQEVYSYTIKSVEEAVKRYAGKKWLVINKFYAKEIKKQLLKLGVSEENIICIEYVPEVNEVYNYF